MFLDKGNLHWNQRQCVIAGFVLWRVVAVDGAIGGEAEMERPNVGPMLDKIVTRGTHWITFASAMIERKNNVPPMVIAPKIHRMDAGQLLCVAKAVG
jgi:hypothetical protein